MNRKLRKPVSEYVSLALAALLLGACANQMQPAQQALDGVNNAISAVAPDAEKYMPGALAPLQSKAADLKASFDNKDYRAVLLGAPAVLADTNSLTQAVAIKKQKAMQVLASAWSQLAISVPKLVETVKERVDALSKSKHVPKGMDLAAARSALADATSTWAMAQASYAAGHVEDAVNSANVVKTKAEAAAEAIKLKLTAAASAPAK